MFQMTEEERIALGAQITTKEILQQPQIWSETFDLFVSQEEALESFFKEIIESANGNKVRVIFTGSGTSEYVGNSICPYLQLAGDRLHFRFESIATTDLVAAPQYYFFDDEPTLLVSFARSGNSPESVSFNHYLC
ncbi:AgaS family protein [Streptococcus ictaluri 707-05]|uniref:AgaS family protein n=1 Tax=Streptococcus ictaluri 707-05 TaxID=764299 RepID=G5K0D1_9STRE|nr:AgaS family protein [Streptococcus ictaluri 707-05]